VDLVPSPVARTLLALRARRFDGEVEVAGRTVLFRAGMVADVAPGDGDPSLTEFLVRAGQLTQSEADALAGSRHSLVIAKRDDISEDALVRATRACWVERLARALGDASFDGEIPNRTRSVPSAAVEVELVPLLLDALRRNAEEEEAGIVGSHPKAIVRYGAEAEILVEEAMRWSGLRESDFERPVAQILARHPGAAARIAALVRGGFATLGSADRPPAPRRSSMLPPARTSLAPPRAPQRELVPGAEVPTRASLATPLPALTIFPPASQKLDDPLLPVERRIAQLEQSGAPGAARAAEWKRAAQLWQRHHGSLEEAARAYREAAAADPRDREALRQATALCAATGELELARAYARATTAASSQADAKARAAALREEARLAERAGDVEDALAKLEASAKLQPRGEVFERIGRLAGAADQWWCREEPPPKRAVEAFERAAKALSSDQPTRARNLLAWLARPDVEGFQRHVRALAEALKRDGHAEAAIHHLGEAAHRTEDRDARRLLRMEGAELAESLGRADLACELLLEAHFEEPELDVLYEPVAADLESGGWPARLAVVCERFAQLQPDEEASWLARAASAFDTLPGAASWAQELRIRALCARPEDHAIEEGPLAMLRERASKTGDYATLADALERAAGSARERGAKDAAIALLETLAPLAEERLGSGPRALWAWQGILELQPSDRAAAEVARLSERVRLKDGLLEMAERDYENASGQRGAAARKLASLLRDQPGARSRAAELYRQALEADPGDRTAARSLDRLLRLIGDDDALESRLRDVANTATSESEQVRASAELAGLLALRGDWRSVAEVTRVWVRMRPGARDAVARLEIAALVTGDEGLRREAWEARLALPDERGQARVRVARARDRWDRGGDAAAVVADLERALTLDPRAADALAFAERWLPQLMPPDEALPILERARAVLGDHWLLLDTLRRLSGEAAPERVPDLLSASLRLAPHDPKLAADALRTATERGDTSALRSAIEKTLGLAEPPWDELEAAVLALANASSPDDAARVALHVVDGTGHPRLLDVGAQLAESVETRIAVTERRAAFAYEDAPRIAALWELSTLHRDRESRAAEARALLRLLAEEPHHADALARLAEVYAETGETDRLLAVLALKLEAAERPSERRRALFDLAAATMQRADDGARAEEFLRQSMAEAEHPIHAARDAAGVFVALGSAEHAVAFLLECAEQAEETADARRLAEQAVNVAEQAGLVDLALDTAATAVCAGHGGDVLLSFERLALQTNAVDEAKRVYGELIDRAMGRHGRRGTLYRQARWLERAACLPEALDAYIEAFAESPGEGVVFAAIERLARATERWEPLAKAYGDLADRQTHVDRRLAFERGAVQVLDEELDDPKRAFERLANAWRITGQSVLMKDLRQLVRRWGERDPEGVEAGYATLHEGLRLRIEQTWDEKDQVKSLRTIAELYALEQGDLEAGRAVIHDELAPLAEKVPDDVPAEMPTDALVALAGWQVEAGDVEGARVSLQRALSFVADHDVAKERLAELAPSPESEAEPAPSDGGEVVPSSGATESGDAPATDAEANPDPTALSDATASTSAEDDARSSDPEPVVSAPPEPAATSDGDASASASTPERAATSEADASASLEPASEPDATSSHEPASEADATSSHEPDATSSTPETATSERDARSDAERESPTLEAAPPAPAATPEPRPPEPTTTPEPEPEPEASEARYGADRDAPRTLVESAPDEEARPAPSPNLSRWRAAERPDYDTTERALRERIAAGDVAAIAELGTFLVGHPDRLREAAQVLLQTVRREPWRVDALEQLHDAATRSGASTLAEATADVLSLFRSDLAPPETDLTGWGAWSDAVDALLRPRPAPLLDALAIVWESARPLFRRSLGDFGIAGTQRVHALDARPFGAEYALATKTLGLDGVHLFVRPASQTGEPSFLWAPTQPPAVIVAEDEENRAGRRFRIARALELARGPHLLLSSRPAAEMRTVIEAIYAAFGAPQAIGEVMREAASFAADLWRTIPARDQVRLRGLLDEMTERPTLSSALTEALRAGARAGLLVDGSVHRSALALAEDEAQLDAEALRTREGVSAAARTCEPFAALLRLGLGDTALAARAHARTT